MTNWKEKKKTTFGQMSPPSSAQLPTETLKSDLEPLKSDYISFKQFCNLSWVGWLIVLYLAIQYYSYFKSGEFLFNGLFIISLMNVNFYMKFFIATLSVFGISFVIELIVKSLQNKYVEVSSYKIELLFKALANSITINALAIWLSISFVVLPTFSGGFKMVILSIIALIILSLITYYIIKSIYALKCHVARKFVK